MYITAYVSCMRGSAAQRHAQSAINVNLKQVREAEDSLCGPLWPLFLFIMQTALWTGPAIGLRVVASSLKSAGKLVVTNDLTV